MRVFNNYKLEEKIFESSVSLVYRGFRKGDEVPIVVKILKNDYPSREDIVRYRQEFEILKGLSLSGVVKAYSQEKYGNSLAIIFEDFGGESLRNLWSKQEFSLSKSIELALKICEILRNIHWASVIHKDINPANIVYNPDSEELKVIDFGISSTIPQENPVLSSPERLEGTLNYMSPEQTGRMNRILDYRSDFYSLGATFYEMFTGQTPFDSDDSVELVHCHMARQPRPLFEINPKIPACLSQIVLKLLAKRAEDRYQSIRGLQGDLEIAQEVVGGAPEPESFKPGRIDVSARFSLPQKLYGREAELELLLNAAERAVSGACEALFVGGYSGVGKTALVGEVQKVLFQSGLGTETGGARAASGATRRGYFIAGKFDQYHRNIPYLAVLEAFRDLVRQILTEDETRLKLWKKNLEAALAPNGGVMNVFLPELELIIGEQPLPSELDGAEALNRFNLVFQKFLGVFCTAEHPLVLFLDDLQWAHTPSLNLLELMLAGGQHLFFIGAYRDNEVGPTHPLLNVLAGLDKKTTPVYHIALKSLERDNVRRFIAEATHRDVKSTDELAEVSLKKTDGNPYFLGEFLKSLQREGALYFEAEAGVWNWKMDKVREQSLSENVVELMARRIHVLKPETREVLKMASCLGNHFDLDSLGAVYEKSALGAATDLLPALEEGLIQPLSSGYQVAALVRGADEMDTQRYRFAHDRVQEAAYSIIPEEEKPALHLEAGRLLLKTFRGEKRGRNIFEIVDHLNMGLALMTSWDEQEELVRLNLAAGRAAQSSAAFESALSYYKQGLDLLGLKGWETHYNLSLALSTGATEAAYLKGDYSEMEKNAAATLARTANLLDGVKIYEIQILALQARNEGLQAVKLSLEVLGKLGERFPDKPNTTHIILGLLRTKIRLAGKTNESLLNLPDMAELRAQAIIRIMIVVSNSTFQTSSENFLLSIFASVKLSLLFGNSKQSPLAYLTYGVVLISALNDIKEGARFAELARELMEKKGAENVRTRLQFGTYSLIHHWQIPLRDLVDPLWKNHQTGLERGDLEAANNSIEVHAWFALLAGWELGAVEKVIDRALGVVTGLGHQVTRVHLNIGLQLIYNFQQGGETPALLSGDVYREEELLPEHEKARARLTLFYVWLCKLWLSYVFLDFEEAYHNAQQALKYQEGALATILIPFFNFYESLAFLGVYGKKSGKEQRRIRKKVKANQKNMKLWADFAPSNQLHRYYLVEAECARVLGQKERARTFYDQALEAVGRSEILYDEALVWELAARFYLECELNDFAGFCLRNARYGYRHWGAMGKVTQLESHHPEILLHEETPFGKQKETSDVMSVHTTLSSFGNSIKSTSRSHSGALDLATILKAAQIIAGETDLERLLRNLMMIVLENAGAERGVLLLQKGEKWVLEAEGRWESRENEAKLDPETSQIEVLLNQPLEEAQELPLSVINYLINTSETIVLDSAHLTGRYIQDPYIWNRSVKSILCAPLIHQNKMTGILYLENNLTEGAFTPGRLELVGMLSAIIAIAIQNAFAHEQEKGRIKAEAENRAKSEFLAGVSHELRTPLNGILGFSQLLSRSEHMNSEDKERVEVINSSGHHLLNLIDDVLELSRIEAKRLDLRSETVQLPDLLRTTAELFEIQARKKDLAFKYEKLTPLPSAILADEKRLRQIIFNLVGNAVRYTEKGEINLRASYEDETLTIEVEDTGIGIAADDLEKIFEPFRQAAGGLRVEGSTGLGLSISKKLVELMEGKLKVFSIPGKGSRFIFQACLSATVLLEDESIVNGKITGYQGPSRKILIVDDNGINRDLLRDLLSSSGFEIEEAVNGEEALTLARELQPDIILMDKVMPVMDGLACTREIKKDESLKHIFVIMLSASVFEEDSRLALEAGADAFLSKPIHLSLLLELLGRKLGLKWLRQGVSASAGELPLAEMVGPSLENAQRIFDLAQRGDIQAILDMARELEQSDQALGPYVQEINRLARGFQERKLQEFAGSFVGK